MLQHHVKGFSVMRSTDIFLLVAAICGMNLAIIALGMEVRTLRQAIEEYLEKSKGTDEQ